MANSAFAQNNGNGNGGGNGGGNGNGNGGGNSGGNGNAGGNSNGNGNSGGNAGGNGNGSASKPPSQNAPESKPGSDTKNLTAARQLVERQSNAFQDALSLARNTQRALRQALLDADLSTAVRDDLKSLARRSPKDKMVLKLLQDYEALLRDADESLRLAYLNHLKAMRLVDLSRRALESAQQTAKRLR